MNRRSLFRSALSLLTPTQKPAPPAPKPVYSIHVTDDGHVACDPYVCYSLREAVAYAKEWGWGPKYTGLCVYYHKGDQVYLNWRRLCRPGHTRDEIREILIEGSKRWLEPGVRYLFGPEPSEEFKEENRQRIKNGPTKEEIDDAVLSYDPVWLEPEELDRIEAAGFVDAV